MFGSVQKPSLFGGGASAPNSLFGNQAQTTQQQQTSLFGNTSAANQNPNQSTTQPQSNTSSAPQIDLDHLRPTTKFDHLTPALQEDIYKLDQAIVQQMNFCSEVAALLPIVIENGSSVPNDVAYVESKLNELDIALENDAADIDELRSQTVKRDWAEAKLCFKSVDRLKMPAQYQAGHHHHHHQGTDGSGITGGVYGGSGLSGWWNNPQMLQRTMRSGATHSGGRAALQLPEEEEKDIAPGTLVDLFSARSDEMRALLEENRQRLAEIEVHVGGVEGKILEKQREIESNWKGAQIGGESERERQVKMLRYVFGEVERSLYDVADKVAECRDGVKDLEEKASRGTLGF